MRILKVLLPLVLLTATVHAQDVEKSVQRMNKKAMDDYDSLEFDSARKTLIDAIAMLRANGLDETPLAAKTFVNLGILYIAGFKDTTRGKQQFVAALKIKPDIKLDPAIATPELDEAFAAALKQVGGRKAPPPPVEKPPPPVEKPPPPKPPSPDEVKGLQHNPVDESRPNTPVPIRAQLGSDVGASKLFLFYRSSGQEDFVSVPMKNTGGADWVGVIPAEAVMGRALQYYLEARDQRGRPVVGSGSAPNPYIIAINEAAAPPSAVPEVDVEDPLAQQRARRLREEQDRLHGKRHWFYLFAMIGTGFGYEPGGNHTEVAWQYQSSNDSYIPEPVSSGGAALSPLHIDLEAGAFATRKLTIGVLARFQALTGANAQTTTLNNAGGYATYKAPTAIAALLRVRYLFLEGRFHPYVHVDIGGGEIRHYLDITSASTPDRPLVDQSTASAYNGGDKMTGQPGVTKSGNQNVCPDPQGMATCTDSINLGYFLIGGGAGLWIDFLPPNSRVNAGFILDLNLLGAIGVGSGQTGMNFDVAAGFGFHL
jgi:hypothetical protein